MHDPYLPLAFGPTFTFSHPPKPKWEMAPTGDFFTLTIQMHAAPNGFHRLMQLLILGVKYRRIKSA